MRVLVVEDEPELRELVRAALVRAGFAVDATGTVADADESLRMAAFDAVVLDLGLADGDGLTLLRGLRARGEAVPVLILTARDGPDERVAGLDAGSDDYLVKPFHMPELLSRIRALLRRPNAALGLRLEAGNVAFLSVERQASVAGAPLRLSMRETALLELLMRRAGRVVTREVIEQSLYGFDEPLGSNAVEVLVHRLRRKLQDAGASLSVHTLRGVGYLLSEAA